MKASGPFIVQKCILKKKLLVWRAILRNKSKTSGDQDSDLQRRKSTGCSVSTWSLIPVADSRTWCTSGVTGRAGNGVHPSSLLSHFRRALPSFLGNRSRKPLANCNSAGSWNPAPGTRNGKIFATAALTCLLGQMY